MAQLKTRVRSNGADRAPNEEGAVIIVVALAMVALLGLVALVVDLGGAYDHDLDLQTAADAGALAGAQELVYETVSPQARATEYIDKNVYGATGVAGSSVVEWAWDDPGWSQGDRWVEVDIREDNVNYLFAPVIGNQFGTVRAHARAELMFLTGMDNLFPVALMYMIPDHFRFTYTNGSTTFSYLATNPDAGKESDDGVYSGSKPLDAGDYSPGLYTITVRAEDASNNGSLEWDGGSWWVAADSNEPVQRVGVVRTTTVPADYNAQLTESLYVEILTNASVDPTKVLKIDLGGDVPKNSSVPLVSPGKYAGTVALPTPSFKDGSTVVEVTVDDKKVRPAGELTIARLTWFQRGEAIYYIKLTPEPYDGYSGVPGGDGGLNVGGEVKVKVFHFNEPTALKVAFASAGGYRGNVFWADIYHSQNLRDEIVGPQPGDDWTLDPDVNALAPAATKNNGWIDIGEWINTDTGKSMGQARAAFDRVGDTVYIPLVDPPVEPMTGNDYLRINSFAAFEIVKVWEDKDIFILGEFVEKLAAGAWQDHPPAQLYVETAVLTE